MPLGIQGDVAQIVLHRRVYDQDREDILRGAHELGPCSRAILSRAEDADEAVVLTPEPDSPPGQIRAMVPESYGDTFEYQFGVQFSSDGYPYWEDWKSVKGL